MTKYVIFESDPIFINFNSGNTDFIYKPTGIFNTGKSFKIKPGQKIIVIPVQPGKYGCWRQQKLEIQNGKVTESEQYDYFLLIIENCWLKKTVTVAHGATLHSLLACSNISHTMMYASFHTLQTILLQKENKPNNESDDETDEQKKCEHDHYTQDLLQKLTSPKPYEYFSPSIEVSV